MIPFTHLDLAAAWGLDLIIGDPPVLSRLHPVVLTGKLIAFLEKALYGKSAGTGRVLRGGILFLLTVGIVFAAGFGAVALLGRYDENLGRAVGVVLAFFCVATRDLDRQVRRVAVAVKEKRLEEARKHLSMIVGRDTENLSEREILRGAFETAAENSSDGVVAPLFYLALGGALGFGPALGLAYKAVNTLDSMVGYRSERYKDFGKVSARADDLFNYVPARLTLFLVALSALFGPGKGLRALKIAFRDARLHASPNSGYPEAAYAGALGVCLGGTNVYKGVERASPFIGDDIEPLTPKKVLSALTLTRLLSLFALLLFGGCLWFFQS
ncbi:cobalamin biosynthesis protein CobD [bacterium]|nr:MAG: cobalamin biosynthesis protein CobD [bacterium]